MIEFPELPKAIESAGPKAASLAGLATSPVSRTTVKFLAERSQFELKGSISEPQFDLYVCEDCTRTEIPLPSPFAVVCVGPEAVQDAQELSAAIQHLLKSRDLHAKPVILLHDEQLGALGEYLDLSEIVSVPLSPQEMVEILTAHPPHAALMKRVALRTPVTLLNPYVFRGPIGANLFFGRHNQLAKLCGGKASYALVGPRAIGKTSLINRAYDDVRAAGGIAIRAEFGIHRNEHQLLERFYAGLIDNFEARPSVQLQMSANNLARIVERKSSATRKVLFFIDEADEL